MLKLLASEDLSDILQLPDLQEYGRVAYDSRAINKSVEEDKALVVIPQDHGNEYTQFLISDPRYAELFLRHHNQIRALATMITGRDGHIYVEGVQAGITVNNRYLASVHEYECCAGTELFLADSSVRIFSGNLRKYLEEVAKFELEFEEQLHYIKGAMRHLAWYVMNGGGTDRIHGIEPPQAQEFLRAMEEGGPLMGTFMVAAELSELNLLRNTTIVEEVRKSLHRSEVGVLVLGAGHVGEGEKAIFAGEVLQNTFARELPNTRLVILEPNDIPSN